MLKSTVLTQIRTVVRGKPPGFRDGRGFIADPLVCIGVRGNTLDSRDKQTQSADPRVWTYVRGKLPEIRDCSNISADPHFFGYLGEKVVKKLRLQVNFPYI